jgi:hypothetical protein
MPKSGNENSFSNPVNQRKPPVVLSKVESQNGITRKNFGF